MNMRVAVRVVVAAQVRAAGGAALAERRAAELAGPDDQRLVEQAARSSGRVISAGDRLVHRLAAASAGRS